MKRNLLILLAIGIFGMTACYAPSGPQPVATAVAPAAPTQVATATATSAPTAMADETSGAPAPGSLVVDPAVDLGPISPYVYGTNYGPMHAVPIEMMPDIIDSGFTALRWPGGAWTDTVDMQPFQLDQFVWFYEQLGALPTVSVRLHNSSPETAASLVSYARDMNYGIEYWSIGNEPTLYEEQFNESYDTERFNREWRAIAEAMKAADPSIKLMGPELHQWNSSLTTTLKDSAGRDWMTEFLQANGDLVDVVTVHRYPYWSATNEPATFDQMQASAAAMNDEVAYLRDLIKETTGRDLPVAITELNSTPTSVQGQPASPDSFYNAIWYADVLGRLISEDVWMVNQWVISQRTTGLGLISGFTIRPTLYTFQMYKHFGDQQVEAHSGTEGVNVYAALRDDGALTVMVVNLTDEEQTVPLQVAGAGPSEAEIWLLDAEHNAENLGIQPLSADGTVTLPAQSVTLYVIQ
ncbi:MAG: hypothetical protein H6647_21215 [Anaerolineales bacterium]|nr:hypothetical protein [Anaerolineales bacterium]